LARQIASIGQRDSTYVTRNLLKLEYQIDKARYTKPPFAHTPPGS
jgi:hypothetical protein